MATTHVFIVDLNTFDLHLKYLFAGTGAKKNIIDFNNCAITSLHHTTENNLVGMIADINRIRRGDLVIFYLQQNFSEKIYEGKFYGIFEVQSDPFLDNNDSNQFLKNELKKSLTFRVLLKPYKVYSKGITEWEALDSLHNINHPSEMNWSLIYRKLKGNRGCTMITDYESKALVSKIAKKNNNNAINAKNYSFDYKNQEIVANTKTFPYTGRQDQINILPRLLEKLQSRKAFEAHLQAYILENVGVKMLKNFFGGKVDWIGNEVSCGVGMQRIDILLHTSGKTNTWIPIELKACPAYDAITHQIQRYVNWIEDYLLRVSNSIIEPVIISYIHKDKKSYDYQNLIRALKDFNSLNKKKHIYKLRYIEFDYSSKSKKLDFKEVHY